MSWGNSNWGNELNSGSRGCSWSSSYGEPHLPHLHSAFSKVLGPGLGHIKRIVLDVGADVHVRQLGIEIFQRGVITVFGLFSGALVAKKSIL